MNYERIVVKKEHRIGILTLNRPDKLNAFDPKSFEELKDAFAELESDDEIRVILVNGAGRVFSSGADFKSDILVPDVLRKVMDRIAELILMMKRLPKPIIVAVHGAAAGGGMNFALAGDIVLAAEGTMFSQPYILRGLHPDAGGSYFLPHLIGAVRACELFFTGRNFDADEAYRIGLINQVVPIAELETRAKQLAMELAKRPPKAMRLIKYSIYQALEMSLASVLEREARSQLLCAMSDELKEGIQAFLEKREPVF